MLANQLHTSGMLHYLQLQGFVTLGIKVQSFKNSSTGKHNMCEKRIRTIKKGYGIPSSKIADLNLGQSWSRGTAAGWSTSDQMIAGLVLA